MTSSAQQLLADLEAKRNVKPKPRARKAPAKRATRVSRPRTSEPLITDASPEPPLRSDSTLHLLYSCASCRIPKRCEMQFAPFCGEQCRKRGRR